MKQKPFYVTKEDREAAREAAAEMTAGLVSTIEDRINDLSEQLKNGVSEGLLTFMRFAASFYSYSPNNQMLIWCQAPEAQFVAGFRAWMAKGRVVKKGSKAIRIFAPLAVADREQPPQASGKPAMKVVGFKAAAVFPDYMTEGEPIPEMTSNAYSVEGTPRTGLLTELSARCPVKVSWVNEPDREASGWTNGKSIHLNSAKCKEGEGHAVRVLIHEWAHVALHFQAATNKRPADLPEKGVRELEADAVAYVVCGFLGLDARAAVADYITMWGGDAKKLGESLARIQYAASSILKSIGEAPEGLQGAAD